jgi:hypothetical protein
MPALSTTLLKTNIKANLVAAGLVKYTFDGDGNPIPSGQIAENLEKIVDAFANGFSTTFEIWRASQTVVGTATVTTAPGVAPVTGTLP